MARAVHELLATPPPSKQMREIAMGLGAIGGDAWFVDTVTPHLLAAKVPTPVLDFVEELYMHADDATEPLEQARVLVLALNRQRASGSGGRRATWRNCLGRVDDGSAWATWLLEAATPGKGHEDGYETWASEVLRRWASRDRVRDHEAAPFMASLPRLPPWSEFVERPARVAVELDAGQRAALEGVERRWLGNLAG